MADDESPKALPSPRPRPKPNSTAAQAPKPPAGLTPAEYFDLPTESDLALLAEAEPELDRPRVPARRIPNSKRRGETAAKFTDALPAPIRNSLDAIGGMYSMGAASIYGLGSDVIRGRFQFAEFTERSWFLVNATLLPAMLVSIPLGVAIALQVGALAAQIGATSFVGAADAIGVLREASPIVTALLLAGVGGSAVCAELGSRTIREEIDAMIVLGLNPLRRLVAPLLVAGVLAAALLNLIVIFMCIFSAYVFDLAALHGTKGSFFGSFTQFATMSDFVTSEIKASIFGLTAVLIAAYKGLNAKRGPTGVGEAVNQAVVITGIVLFAINLIVTEIFFALVPQRTF
jgi:phospholipid/cholesterol/gamma-HCH transport system permease protein